MKPRDHISLHCIYCDDIRDEKGGKTTIVGWYGGDAVVPLPPEGVLLLPSFGVVGVLTMPWHSKYKSMLVELLQGEKVLQSVPMPVQKLDEMQVEVGQAPKPEFGQEVRIAIKMNNFAVAESGILRMRIVLDDEAIYSNGLNFTR